MSCQRTAYTNTRIHCIRNAARLLRNMLFTAVLLAPILATGCAHSTASGTIDPGAATSPIRNATVLVGSELASAGTDLSLYEALQRLRPEALHWRARRSSLDDRGEVFPVVYVDGARVGDIEALRAIPCANVRKVVLIPAGEAAARYGAGHDAGAILVTRRPQYM